jgi:short chain dehydrogenase
MGQTGELATISDVAAVLDQATLPPTATRRVKSAGPAAAQGGGTTTTLVTGANKGLGLETARRLVAAGHTVYAGMRDLSCGDAGRELGAISVQLDVNDHDSVDKAIASLPEPSAGGVHGIRLASTTT